MEHKDHKGNHGLLRPGSVQWMTAGRGIIHSEMPKQEEGLMHGFQMVKIQFNDFQITISKFQKSGINFQKVGEPSFSQQNDRTALPRYPTRRHPCIKTRLRRYH
jgi:hypothetical protein